MCRSKFLQYGIDFGGQVTPSMFSRVKGKSMLAESTQAEERPIFRPSIETPMESLVLLSADAIAARFPIPLLKTIDSAIPIKKSEVRNLWVIFQLGSN